MVGQIISRMIVNYKLIIFILILKLWTFIQVIIEVVAKFMLIFKALALCMLGTRMD